MCTDETLQDTYSIENNNSIHSQWNGGGGDTASSKLFWNAKPSMLAKLIYLKDLRAKSSY